MENSNAINLTTDSTLPSDSAQKEENVAEIRQPTYAAAFRCIGSSCEDPCCSDWDIPLDKKTYRCYQHFPQEKLGAVVSQFVIVNGPDQPEELYASIRRTKSGCCPFFGTDHLCGIQKEYGSRLLSSTCSIYPRSLSVVAGKLEGSLSLSCPEAARNVLLIPDFMQRVEDLFSGDFRTDNVYHLAGDRGGSIPKPHPIFLALRRMLIDTVRDRSRPMWYRLLKIGHLCQDVDALVMAEGDSASLSSFKNFRQLSEDRLSHAELNEMPGNPRLRFEVVFALTEALVREGAKIRFQDTFWTFVEGISASVNSLPGDDVQRFLQAEQTYHLPFFDTLPSVLENYLINYMYQNLFPYGREGSGSFASQSIFVEYLQMTTQFAWVNALLIGVAGHYKESFAAEHVVQTIQSFTRTVEHYPHVLNSMNEYIRSLGLNNLRGMAIMLKH